jgi:hypothetical protein
MKKQLLLLLLLLLPMVANADAVEIDTPVRDKKVFKKFGNHKDFLYLYI